MRCAGLFLAWLATCIPIAASARAQTVAIAGFDYQDSSGEVRDQSAEHAARLAAFPKTIEAGLDQSGHTAIVLDCAPACTAGKTPPDVLIGRARQEGATWLLYGGIHKMSTLVQEGLVQVVDIRRNRLVVQRLITFRGDTDESWRHAARFIARSVAAGLAGP